MNPERPLWEYMGKPLLVNGYATNKTANAIAIACDGQIMRVDATSTPEQIRQAERMLGQLLGEEITIDFGPERDSKEVSRGA